MLKVSTGCDTVYTLVIILVYIRQLCVCSTFLTTVEALRDGSTVALNGVEAPGHQSAPYARDSVLLSSGAQLSSLVSTRAHAGAL